MLPHASQMCPRATLCFPMNLMLFHVTHALAWTPMAPACTSHASAHASTCSRLLPPYFGLCLHALSCPAMLRHAPTMLAHASACSRMLHLARACPTDSSISPCVSAWSPMPPHDTPFPPCSLHIYPTLLPCTTEAFTMFACGLFCTHELLLLPCGPHNPLSPPPPRRPPSDPHDSP